MRRALVLLGLIAAWPCSAPNVRGPETVQFESPLGPVSFGHARHGQELAVDCRKCHHQETPAGQAMQPCRLCHRSRAETVEGGPPSFYQVKMEFCRGCHREENERRRRTEQAPVSCEQCHQIKKMLKQAAAPPLEWKRSLRVAKETDVRDASARGPREDVMEKGSSFRCLTMLSGSRPSRWHNACLIWAPVSGTRGKRPEEGVDEKTRRSLCLQKGGLRQDACLCDRLQVVLDTSRACLLRFCTDPKPRVII
ncbi:MAG: cytochrome c3 family protein [bacterium]